MMKRVLGAVLLLVATGARAALTDLTFEPSGVPAFIGRSDVALGKLTFTSDRAQERGTVSLSLEGTDLRNLKSVFLGKTKGRLMGKKAEFKVPIQKGTNAYTLFAEPAPKANLLGKLVFAGVSVRIGSLVTRPNQKIVDADRESKCFRIPGIVQTPKGTLVAVFDNRFHHAGDLPADITVGVSISRDKGTTWSPIRTAMDYKALPGGKGIGDPTILVDPSNGRIWVAALRAPESGHPIWSSSTGTVDPKACGQMILAYSDNEGKTWSKPINITADVKRLEDADTKDWGLLFQGPGAGIAMADGTLVFPAQIWGNKGKRPCYGVLVYSKDHGKTWTSSKAMPFGWSESTVVQLADGSLLLNTREGGGPATRITGRTKDLGQTWEKVETTPLRQPNNLCQAAMLAMNGKLYFSNPASSARDTMTLRVSSDDGKTWSNGMCYDPRKGAGYSSLCPVGKDSIGVLYEGESDYHYFLRIPLDEVR